MANQGKKTFAKKAKSMKKFTVASVISSLVLGLYGCGDPPLPPLDSRVVDSRVVSECGRKIAPWYAAELGKYQAAKHQWAEDWGNSSVTERQHANSATNVELKNRRNQIEEEWTQASELIDRGRSRCEADQIFRTEVEMMVKKDTVDFQKRVKESLRYNKAQEKCGDWHTDEEYRAVLKCIRSYGFDVKDPSKP
jgi:hypothetical protein